MMENMYRHDNSPEDIRCAAIWVDDENTDWAHQPRNIKSGYVICGLRHHNCFSDPRFIDSKIKKHKVVQGFLTSKDRFVNRVEAAHIALSASQIPEIVTQLFSEDLY